VIKKMWIALYARRRTPAPFSLVPGRVTSGAVPYDELFNLGKSKPLEGHSRPLHFLSNTTHNNSTSLLLKHYQVSTIFLASASRYLSLTRSSKLSSKRKSAPPICQDETTTFRQLRYLSAPLHNALLWPQIFARSS